MDSRQNLSYTLFLYRQELRRRDPRYLRLSDTKVLLTEGLISENVRNLQDCSDENLKAIRREMAFRKELELRIARMRTFLQIGFWDIETLEKETTEL